LVDSRRIDLTKTVRLVEWKLIVGSLNVSSAVLILARSSKTALVVPVILIATVSEVSGAVGSHRALSRQNRVVINLGLLLSVSKPIGTSHPRSKSKCPWI
jgi:hypothetical protein